MRETTKGKFKMILKKHLQHRKQPKQQLLYVKAMLPQMWDIVDHSEPNEAKNDK